MHQSSFLIALALDNLKYLSKNQWWKLHCKENFFHVFIFLVTTKKQSPTSVIEDSTRLDPKILNPLYRKITLKIPFTSINLFFFWLFTNKIWNEFSVNFLPRNFSWEKPVKFQFPRSVSTDFCQVSFWDRQRNRNL